EDGIRDSSVTGVQTCALPICEVVLLNRQSREWLARTERAGVQSRRLRLSAEQGEFERALHAFACNPGVPRALQLNGLDIHLSQQIGRASCREREEMSRVRGGG